MIFCIHQFFSLVQELAGGTRKGCLAKHNVSSRRERSVSHTAKSFVRMSPDALTAVSAAK